VTADLIHTVRPLSVLILGTDQTTVSSLFAGLSRLEWCERVLNGSRCL